MKIQWFSLLPFLLLSFWQLNAQDDFDIAYEMHFPNAVHHQAEISITYKNLPDSTLHLQMSLASPGRYAFHQFGKNVFNVKAVDQHNVPLNVERVAPETWQIKQHEGYIKFTYTLFADRTDGTYSEIDDTHAHLNIPATFIWAHGNELQNKPISITFFSPPKIPGGKLPPN